MFIKDTAWHITVVFCDTQTHTRLTALCPGLPGWASTRKLKPIWILLKQETVSGSGISWAICKSVSRSRQITTPTPHHSVFYRPDALPAAQPTASKHWRPKHCVFCDTVKKNYANNCSRDSTESRQWNTTTHWSSWVPAVTSFMAANPHGTRAKRSKFSTTDLPTSR